MFLKTQAHNFYRLWAFFFLIMKTVLSICLLMASLASYAQNKIYYSRYNSSSNPPMGPHIMTLNPYNAKVDTIAHLNLTTPHQVRTINEEGTKALLIQSSGVNTKTYKLYNLSTSQYEFDVSPLPPSGFGLGAYLIIHMDCRNDSIYTLFSLSSSASSAYLSNELNGDSLVVKGTVTVGNQIGLPTHYFVDVKNEAYILLEKTSGSNSQIRVRAIHYRTGQQLYEHALAISGGQVNMQSVIFNCIDNKLYALYTVGFGTPVNLIRIDPTTGSYANINSNIGSLSFMPQAPVYSGNFMYFTAKRNGAATQIYTLNVVTGQLEDSIYYSDLSFQSFIPYQCGSKADFDDTVACAGVAKRFRYTGSGAGAARWELSQNGNIIASSQQLNPFFTLPTVGSYQLKLVTTGCLSSDSITKTVVAIPPPPAPPYFNDNIGLCKIADTINLSLPSGSGLSYSWFKNDTLLSTVSRQLPISNIGTYIGEVSNAGCIFSDTTIVISAQPSSFAFIDTACGSYNFNGQLLTASGTYLDTLTNSSGCDSLITLDLNILPLSFTVIDTAICADAAPYNFNGQLITNSGQFKDTLINSVGCDSLITLNLTVHPLPSPTITGANRVCPGETGVSYQLNPNTNLIANWQVQGGSFPAGFTFSVVSSVTIDWGASNSIAFVQAFNITDTVTGCQSLDTAFWVVQINSLLKPDIANVPDTLCSTAGQQVYQTIFTTPGSQYVWAVENGSIVSQSGNSVVVDWNYPAAGSNTSNVGKIWVAESSNTNLDTCFGVSDTTEIMLAPASIPVNLTAVICSNETPFAFGNRSLSSSGVYVDSLTNRFGCDSLVTLDLLINPTADTVLFDTVCSNTLPYFFNGKLIMDSGQFIDTLSNQFGCDSAITLHLIVHPTKTTNLAAVICADETPYLFGSRNLNQTGLYVDTLQTVLGCDSVVSLDLVINPTYDETLNISLTNETFRLGDEELNQKRQLHKELHDGGGL